MTDEQLTAIDRACAVNVLGWRIDSKRWEDKTWMPSRNIAQAWQVLDKVDHPTVIRKNVDGYWARIMKIDHDVFAAAETAPLAICLACLKAVGWEGEK